jgi:branched-chain amino acid transport system ATP-binding protein
MLSVSNLRVAYGGIEAVKGVSLEVLEGEIVTLIGANGAGKSTLLRAISGLLRPAGGEIRFRDESIGGRPAHAIVKRGLGHVPEGRRVFVNLSVRENLELGAYLRRDRRATAATLEEMFGLFPRLRERQKQAAGTLSGGEQQMLAMARGLMGAPKLLLLDEPSMGLSPLLVREVFDLIGTINARGVTVLLVEQNAHMALSIAHRGYVLETGRIVLDGSADTLANNPEVQAAYLGGE